MKNLKLIAACLFFCAITSIKAQLKVTFDCVKSDSIVYVSEVKNCKKLIIVGKDAKDYKIISALPSMNVEGAIREYPLKSDALSDLFIADINRLANGDLTKYRKVYIEGIEIENIKTGKKEKLSTFKVVVKK